MELRTPLIRRNDWGEITPPPLSDWRPTRTVSVIIPAYRCQPLLDLALAALSRQTYPAELMQVVVVDDGSDPPLELPKIAPENTEIVRVADHATGWGRAQALAVGVEASDGEILHWLDADLLPYPEHVEAQVRWHHVVPDAVTLGYKRFVPEGPWPSPEQVAGGPISELFPWGRTHPHDYVEEIIDSTGMLRRADHLVFRAHVGATAALRRDLYHEAGGVNPELRLGEDSEFGYRLAQAGAVFIPEPQARSWHLGPSHMMRDGDRLRRYNRPFLADLMPLPRWLRHGAPGRRWRVPLVTAVVVADGSYEQVRACVDRLLAGGPQDLEVVLVGPWSSLTDERRRVLDDPLLDLRLLAAWYRSEPRVRLAEQAPDSAFPAPYLVTVPAQLGVSPQTLPRLLALADDLRLGLVRVVASGEGPGTEPPVIELWRTAAVHRARRLLPADAAADPSALADAVCQVWGGRWVTGGAYGVVDLARTAPTGPDGWPSQPPAAAAAMDGQVTPVPVAGMRSLIRASGYVARLGLARGWRRLGGGGRRITVTGGPGAGA